MEEFNINLVGNDEEIKKEEIFNDFDFNYVPINNLPVSYFPLNNGLLSNELKKSNNEILTGGENLTDVSANKLTINSTNSPYTILVKKNIDCNLNLNGTSRKIRLNKGIYTIIFNFNGYNIIKKNNIDIYKELKPSSGDITLDFLSENNLSNVKKISSLNLKSIEINPSVSTNILVETIADIPNYKLLIYKTTGILILNKDIICDVLIVGGGGGGGWYGGGGGGGGVVEKTNFLFKKGTYNITIGVGGIGLGIRNAGNTIINKDGVNILAAGGGGNGESNKNISSGNDIYIVGNIATYGTENNSGGAGGKINYKSSFIEISGGNGANGNGEKGTIKKSGNGGNGKLSRITGKDEYYGGGGGGAINDSPSGSGYFRGLGGLGGGGSGGKDYSTGIIGENGVANKGGGGGGGTKALEVVNGGSGIVIFRVKKEDIEEELTNNDFITSTDTRIINEINNVLEKKMIEFNNEEKPYNYLGIYPLVILIVIFWIFIFLFLLKFVHHYFASIYVYILLFIIIFLLIFGSFWFLYTNNDLL